MASLPISRILHNGRIYTMDAHTPRVSALALMGEQIVAAGDDDSILRLAGAGTRIEDLGGAAVYPGFIDAHIHWQWTSESLQQVDLYNIPSMQAALDRVRDRAATVPAGEWIVGYGWSQDIWGNQLPTAADLDAITRAHPVYLRARSGHAAWVNNQALQLAGIDAHMPDPADGQIERDARGHATGILLEWPAMDLATRLIPENTPDQLATLMGETQRLTLAMGMVGFHDFDYPSCLDALQIVRARGDLQQRVTKFIYRDYIDAAYASGMRGGFGDDWLRLGGLKIFADGALGAHTAWMLAPYEGEPNNLGLSTSDPEEMYHLVHEASLNHGMATAIHAIGDRAVREVLNVFERVRAAEAAQGIPRAARRHRIEHVQVIHPDDLNRLAELELVASMQPIHATSDYRMADQFWGAGRVPYSYNPRLQLDRGVVVAFGSDSPVEQPAPLASIHAAVTRQRADGSPGAEGWTPSARLTLNEALRAYTVGAAYAAGMEHRQGQLAPGFLADLIVMEQDLFELPPSELHATRVRATMVGGEWRFNGIE